MADVERVNVNPILELNNARYRTRKRVKIHFDMTTLTYNA
jgi:hypothetical protein